MGRKAWRHTVCCASLPSLSCICSITCFASTFAPAQGRHSHAQTHAAGTIASALRASVSVQHVRQRTGEHRFTERVAGVRAACATVRGRTRYRRCFPGAGKGTVCSFQRCREGTLLPRSFASAIPGEDGWASRGPTGWAFNRQLTTGRRKHGTARSGTQGGVEAMSGGGTPTAVARPGVRALGACAVRTECALPRGGGRSRACHSSLAVRCLRVPGTNQWHSYARTEPAYQAGNTAQRTEPACLRIQCGMRRRCAPAARRDGALTSSVAPARQARCRAQTGRRAHGAGPDL